MKRKWARLRIKARRLNLKEIILNKNESPLKKAIAVSIGVFIGVLPIWGMQIISAVASAQFFKLNKPLAIIGSYINVTPLFPLLVFFSLKIGALILGNMETLPALNEINMGTAKTYFWIYLVGSIPIAIFTALLFGVITFAISSYLKIAEKTLQPVAVH